MRKIFLITLMLNIALFGISPVSANNGVQIKAPDINEKLVGDILIPFTIKSFDADIGYIGLAANKNEINKGKYTSVNLKAEPILRGSGKLIFKVDRISEKEINLIFRKADYFLMDDNGNINVKLLIGLKNNEYYTKTFRWKVEEEVYDSKAKTSAIETSAKDILETSTSAATNKIASKTTVKTNPANGNTIGNDPYISFTVTGENGAIDSLVLEHRYGDGTLAKTDLAGVDNFYCPEDNKLGFEWVDTKNSDRKEFRLRAVAFFGIESGKMKATLIVNGNRHSLSWNYKNDTESQVLETNKNPIGVSSRVQTKDGITVTVDRELSEKLKAGDLVKVSFSADKPIYGFVINKYKCGTNLNTNRALRYWQFTSKDKGSDKFVLVIEISDNEGKVTKFEYVWDAV